jgi:Fe-S cluster biogenesis protein NfuA
MPRKPPDETTLMRRRIAAALDSLRPAIQSDGGDVELVGIDTEGTVQVRLVGACVGCPSSEVTLKMGIERSLKDQIPEITQVVCVNA